MTADKFFYKLIFLTGLLVFPVIFTCCHFSGNSGGQKKDLPVPERVNIPDSLKTGKVYRDMPVLGNSRQTFALFLPDNYPDKKRWPVIFVFDPHAAGWFPVERYAGLANRFGYILIASNRSRNGIPQTQLNQIIRELFENAFSRFSIDPERVYMMGFSGGARIAVSLALGNPSVRSVIACGGGLPGSGALTGLKSDFLGFAGIRDFNLPELLDLDRQLDQTVIRHHLIVFDGEHEWPDSAIFKDAFYWIVFNEMKDKLIPYDALTADEFLSENDGLTKQEQVRHDLIAEYRTTVKIIDFLSGLVPVSAYRIRKKEIEGKKEFQDKQETLKDILQQENRLKNYYLQNFTVKDTVWWKNEVERLNHNILNQAGEKKNSDIRILKFLSLAAYMQVRSALQGEDLTVAEKYIRIYHIIDPGNPDVWYFSAVLEARKRNAGLVIANLHHAVDKGFDDYQRLSTEQAFLFLLKNREYRKILNELAVKKGK